MLNKSADFLLCNPAVDVMNYVKLIHHETFNVCDIVKRKQKCKIYDALVSYVIAT